MLIPDYPCPNPILPFPLRTLTRSPGVLPGVAEDCGLNTLCTLVYQVQNQELRCSPPFRMVGLRSFRVVGSGFKICMSCLMLNVWLQIFETHGCAHRCNFPQNNHMSGMGLQLKIIMLFVFMACFSTLFLYELLSYVCQLY